MRTSNFPAKVLARQKSALIRLSNKEENLQERNFLERSISLVVGDPNQDHYQERSFCQSQDIQMTTTLETIYHVLETQPYTGDGGVSVAESSNGTFYLYCSNSKTAKSLREVFWDNFDVTVNYVGNIKANGK